ncbi:hypothetical protein [Pseudomonas sp. NA-150]|uniref:hypothetical protein n=1 Tax=Pseudomonas sp. NA-150 TaxID=3367525 RepID=UPI0037C6AD81
MSAHPEYMRTFEEAVLAVGTDPQASFIGFLIRPEKRWVEWYEISLYEEDDLDAEVSIHYQGGAVFSSEGEDDHYCLSDVPSVANSLLYIDSQRIPDMVDLTADYVLHRLFQNLPDPEVLWGNAREAFFTAAVDQAIKSGLATVEGM